MNKQEIIQMAEQCGIPEFVNNESQAENLERFANLIASAERQACEAVCYEIAKDMTSMAAWAANACGKFIKFRDEA